MIHQQNGPPGHDTYRMTDSLYLLHPNKKSSIALLCPVL